MEENGISKEELNQSFRNHMATIDKSGKRKWIYAKKPKGNLWFWRNVVGLSLLAFFFIAPHIYVKGDPLLLFNFFERKFILFGVIFWPQDSYLFFLMMITTIVFIILFTVIYGRVFCGWACPQTIFLELIFRRIEHWIEGDRGAQLRLKKGGWTKERIFKRSLKLFLFALVSLLIINNIIAYLIGFKDLIEFYQAGPSVHPKGFLAMLVFSFLFFGIYTWFREQVCLIVCPYGRMQGVLLDPKTILVSYDHVRGEQRGPLKKGEDRKESGKGDCINCSACVQVCPTGIDIRNGTQLECVNCTACIDACNATMSRIKKPKGLIRYASKEMIDEGKKFVFTNRIKAYSLLLVLLMGFLGFLLINRAPMEATIVRTPGLLYQPQDSNQISNLYNINIINKTRSAMDIDIKLLQPSGRVQVVAGKVHVEPQGMFESAMFVYMNEKDLEKEKFKIQFAIYSNGKEYQKLDNWFIGPGKDSNP